MGVNILVPAPLLISLSPLPQDGLQAYEQNSIITLTRRPAHEPNCLSITVVYRPIGRSEVKEDLVANGPDPFPLPASWVSEKATSRQVGKKRQASLLGVTISLFGELAKGYIERRRASCKGRRPVLDASKGIYLGGTLVSILISLYLFTSGRRETGIFVGLWAPTVLNLGQTLLEDDKD